MDGSANYAPIASLNFQGGINPSAPLLSPSSEQSLSADGTWNCIVDGDSFARGWRGATSLGANTGSRIMCAFGSTFGGIASHTYVDKTFVAPGAVGTNQVTVTAADDYVTGMTCTVSTGGTLPTGLVALTTYYVIVVDSTHLSFATSLANALTGTATSITTGTGSGTITIDVSNSAVTAWGNFLQDIGLSRWGIGSGQPLIEGVRVPGFELSTNLQVQIPSGGVYGPPVQAGLGQPSAPNIGIISTAGSINGSIAAKLERSRPSTGAISLASESSLTIIPQNNRMYVQFPLASTGQTHWRVFFTFQGFGGTGVYYLGSYNGLQDIPESVVASGTAGGGGIAASGSLAFGANATNGETIVVNGVTFTFVTGSSSATNVHIGASAGATAQEFVNVLNASVDPLITVGEYSYGTATCFISYSIQGTVGNAFTLANSSGGHVTRSAATLTGGVDGISRSLEFDFQDGDLIPIEASFDDYPPPAGTNCIRLNTVMNIVGCFSDATNDPTTSSTGTCIAVSKENNYESYVPTSLLYLPEQVVDVLSRPIDDYGFVGCQNSISAIQYVGNRGDDLPSCTITTILPDIGIQYPYNWCHFRGQLLIYTAQGNLILMDEGGSFDTTFAKPVSKLLRSFTTVATSVAYDPSTDSIVVLNNKTLLVFSLAAGIWRQIFLPDFGITGTTLSAVGAKRQMYFTVTNGSANTAYSYDTASVTAPLSFVTNYQNSGGSVVRDIYEMAVAVQTTASTRCAVVINQDLMQTAFRQIQVSSGVANITNTDANFTSAMTGKKFLLFGTGVGGGGTILLQGTVTYVNASTLTLSITPSATLVDALLFLGDYAASVAVTSPTHIPNFFPYLAECRSIQVGVWIQATAGAPGNVLTCDILGATYSSSRSL